ncbi:MAG: alpha/beta hydrolase [Actinomycetota bacterium]|nr:alpha/beta hydrolase [Actinomycetota bacterium]
MTGRVDYNEFGLFHENAAEYDLPFDRPPAVRRAFAAVDPVTGGRRLSALVWQDRDPELVLLHGGSQNAHTWDTVAMALDRPLVAIDLPGHGHSDGPADRSGGQLDAYGNAVDVAQAIRQLAPAAQAVIGMSLGGLTAIALGAEAPELVRKLVLVDVLPGLKAQRAQHITDFVSGPASFASLEELVERAARFNPARSRSSLRRGILHNAEQQPDGTWVWRWARHRRSDVPASPAPVILGPAGPAAGTRYGELWEALSSITVPVLLTRGMRPDSVLDDDDERELLRRLPSAQVIHVEQAGHSLQGDTPLELAAIIEHFVFSS